MKHNSVKNILHTMYELINNFLSTKFFLCDCQMKILLDYILIRISFQLVPDIPDYVILHLYLW